MEGGAGEGGSDWSKTIRWVWWEGKRNGSGPEWLEGEEEDERRERMRRREMREKARIMKRMDFGSLKLKDEEEGGNGDEGGGSGCADDG